MGFTLESFLEPATLANFREHWEREPLLVQRSQPGHYAGLLRLTDVDAVVAAAPPSTVRTIAQGGPPARTPVGQTHVAGFYPDYADGRTIVVNQVHGVWPSVATLCLELGMALGHPIGANLYLTPPGSQGFDVHYDSHDTLILQLAGSKRWRLWGHAAQLPLPRHASRVPKGAEAPAQEFTLADGDMLYIPRGVAHEAMTGEDASLHLTVGIHTVVWADLLREILVTVAGRDVRFREAIPGGLFADSEKLAGRVGELLDVLSKTADVRQAFPRLVEANLRHLPGPLEGHFAALGRLADIGLNTVLARRDGMFCAVDETDDKATICFPGDFVRGPLFIAPALRFAAATPRFEVHALPDLDDPSKLVLARRLVKAGFLAPVRENE